MITIPGIYAAAKVYTDVIEPSAEGQIRALCDQQFAAGSKIRIMPDVHTGKGCTIGTTMTVGDFVVPNLVGVDIGCGMDVVRLSEKRINLPELDSFIRKNIPHGREPRHARRRQPFHRDRPRRRGEPLSRHPHRQPQSRPAGRGALPEQGVFKPRRQEADRDPL